MPACVRRLPTAARLLTAAHLPGAAGLSPAARLLSMAVATLALAGCAQVGSQVVSQVGYYAQSVGGHSALLQAARPVDAVLADPATPPDLRSRLEQAVAARRFASQSLGLPDNDSYTRYADVKRPFVVWNVFATPELSLRMKTSCFPVVGCLDYRGYYSETAARATAQDLKAGGWEVTVGGVPAYSTLGWYDDPLVNTFIRYPAGEVARLIFHELAHQTVYARNDTMFNESFATTVEEIGVERWLQQPDNAPIRDQYTAFATRKRQFIALLLETRRELEKAYGEDTPDAKRAKAPTRPDPVGLSDAQVAERRAAKAAILAELRVRYDALKRDAWQGFNGYDGWFAGEINNARFASVATYHQWVPAFRVLYARCASCQQGSLAPFFAEVKALADLPSADRRRALTALAAGG
ncbi:aminopeptidase [Pigmentiphaga litoralis]|uniref:Putative aminopeptidase n=1 Tax=Pigmentiphaga litoralis TaxID=516702 RepID=A0A7Y9LMC3_9BURK|nr:aminopeptidase [Pigmentiphaga litoralis]NYE24291.1 putative aminopeptidase [Pigmentiphaga litoralis]NYE82095.1 putative aminopeptidase [Pigmentiphaga litoralis]